MYETHFGLRRRPFRPTPDDESYYPATTHEQALDRLVQALADDEGMMLLTGEVGIGKTLICHRLLERLAPETVSAFLTNSHMDGRSGLLQTLLYEFSLPYEGRAEQEMRLALTEFLLQNYKSDKRAVILADEAQNLTMDQMEELRLLGNLEAAHGKAVQVVLVAHPTLAQTLRHAGLAAVRQRLAVRALLEPLGPDEAADYLVCQLRTAGGRPEAIMDSESLEILARGTRGIPRLLNQAAHQALLLAYGAEQKQVDAEAALEALVLLDLDVPSETGTENAEECVSEKLDTEVAASDVHSLNLRPANGGSPTRAFFAATHRPAS